MLNLINLLFKKGDLSHKLITILIVLITEAEVFFGSGNGDKKKEAVMHILEVFCKQFNLPFDKILISKAIDGIVAIMNLVGEFKK